MSVEEKLQQMLNHVECDSSQIFFGEENIKDATHKANENSSSGRGTRQNNIRTDP